MSADHKDDEASLTKPRDNEPSDAELLDSVRIPSHPLGTLSSEARRTARRA